MNMEPEQWAEDSRAGRGLVHYIDLVAHAVGTGTGGSLVSMVPPATAYLALDERLPRFPDHDVALVWHEHTGWSIGIETGREVVTLGNLGDDILPAPSRVALFVADMIADRASGRPAAAGPPPGDVTDDLSDRLAAYASVVSRFESPA